MGGWNGQVNDQYVQNWAAVAAEYSRRYGDKVKGWWVDGCYAHIGYNETRWRILALGRQGQQPARHHRAQQPRHGLRQLLEPIMTTSPRARSMRTSVPTP